MKLGPTLKTLASDNKIYKIQCKANMKHQLNSQSFIAGKLDKKLLGRLLKIIIPK